MCCTNRWWQRCWLKLQVFHPSAGGSSKRAGRFPACARLAKRARAPYGKLPDRRGGRKQLSNTLLARPAHLNRYLKLQRLYQKLREKNSYEESLRRQLT